MRVRLMRGLDFAPYTFVMAGETGEIIGNQNGEVWVRLDRHHPGLAYFDNAIWFNQDSPEPFEQCVRALPAERGNSKALLAWRIAISAAVVIGALSPAGAVTVKVAHALCGFLW